MIERINNGMVVLKPVTQLARKANSISVGIQSAVSEPADYLYDPNLAEKINTSRESIKEEIGYLKEAEVRRRGDGDPGKVRHSSLDLLKRSLARIESLLYQVASVAAGDSDSLEALQRKLAEELLDHKKIFRRVELHEIVPPDLDLEDISIGGKIDADRMDPNSVPAARELVSSAKDSIDRILELAGEQESNQSQAEAVLCTTDQNLAAAESALYPGEIMSRAKEASVSVRDRMLEAFGAQAHLHPDHVFKLTSNV